jgi:TonB family protein
MKLRLVKSLLIAFLIAVAVVVTAQTSAAQDPLAAARDLYAAAAYEDALVTLDRLAANDAAPDRFAINQYRAFCLLALGRTSDAERAIEAMVTDRPFYRPSDAEASPRLRSAFTTVRQRMLPAIAQQKYVHAKNAFDQKDFAVAEAGFGQVIDTLADPDLGAAATRPPLSDLGTLAAGFRDLSTRSVAAALETAKAQEVKDEPLAPLPAAGLPAGRIFTANELSVNPPEIVRQDFPSYRQDGGPLAPGVVEIVIDETGRVESAVVRRSMNPRYDKLILTASRNWRYKPATLDGEPIKFRKVISVSMKPVG